MSHDDTDDDSFERALLRSARRDAPDAGGRERAWSRFAALTAGLAAAHGGGRHVDDPSVTAAPGRGSGALAAAKWWIIGALTGSALTFGLVGRHASVSVPTSIEPAPPRSLVSTAVPAPIQTASEPRSSPEPQPSPGIAAPVPSSRIPARAHVEKPRQALEARESSGAGAVAAPRDDASTLAAEVAALDAAQSALEAGLADEALRILARYRRDFPNGKLVPEAEATDIEALAAKGDRERAVAESNRFLERYPNAPQRARVEQLRVQAIGK
jgi:ribosomal protein S11